MRLQKQFSFKSKEQYERLVDLARKHDLPSISGLVQAIADGDLPLEDRATLHQQEALIEAVQLLQAFGKVTATKEVAQLLLERGWLSPALRSSIDGSFAPLFAPWIVQLEEFISHKQPFGLSYQDAAGRVWHYTVRYAQMRVREKRNYLECWCEETQGNQDLPQLKHNWTLRLDRIVEAGIVPIDAQWRDGLDFVEVEFELLGGLAHAYSKREADIEVKWLNLDPPIKRVVRHIFNTFWFIREVLPYGKDCIVIAPEKVRSLVVEQLDRKSVV